MRNISKQLCGFVCVLVLAIFISEGFEVQAKESSRWNALLSKYQEQDNVDCLIFVKYKGSSKADFCMYRKTKSGTWNCVVKCDAYVGQNGINKSREGDRKTPTGIYNITMGMGLKKNPGTAVRYKKINRHLYWSARKKDYNTLVDSRKAPGVYGEHLVEYKPYYNYALVLDYNRKCIYKKGSAIFLHCAAYKQYTQGCIAIKEKYMKRVMKKVTRNTKICIYRR